MLSVAQRIKHNGWEKLGEAFKNAFPNVSYTPHYARRRLLQMPLVCIRVDYKPGVHECFLLESLPGVNYQHFIHLFQAVTQHTPQQTTALSKQELKSLLSVCKSDRERTCMRYTVFKVSGLSATNARKQFGFQNISKQVKEALKQCQVIRDSIDKLANIQEKSLLLSLGIPVPSDSEESDDELSDGDDCVPDSDVPRDGGDLALPSLLEIVKKSNFNWFQIMEVVTVQYQEEIVVEQLYKRMELLDLSNQERQLLNVSYEAFTASEQCEQDRNCSLNGYIVSERSL
jgi:hypothetical protein